MPKYTISGDRICAARNRHNMSAKELAKNVGLTHRTIYHYESLEDVEVSEGFFHYITALETCGSSLDVAVFALRNAGFAASVAGMKRQDALRVLIQSMNVSE